MFRSFFRLSLIVLAVAVMATAASAAMITENFGSDPGWAGSNNTGYGTNNYTFSNTGNASGSAGEAGGSIMSRSSTATYYADSTLADSSYSLTTPELKATGQFVIPSDGFTFDGGFDLGFFNPSSSYTPSVDPYTYAEHMGIQFIDNGATTTTYKVKARMGTVNSTGMTLDVGTQYKFEMTYDPTGGGAGVGRLTGKFFLASDNSQVGSTQTCDLSTEGTSWALDHYGLSTCVFTDSNLAGPNFYVDNLAYGTPEPSTIVLLTIGLFGLMAYAWKKRR